MSILILAYHRVNDWSADTLSVPPERFRRQINSLKKRYQIVSLKDILAARKEGLTQKERLAAITFDDGYFDNYRYAYPILKESGSSATFFLTVSYIGTRNLLPRDKEKGLPEKDRLLNWPEVAEMAKDGFTFGSHSLTHINLTAVSPSVAREEITKSRQILEEKTKDDVGFFCYPFGRHSPEIRQMVAEAGYQAALFTPAFISCCSFCKSPESGPYSLKRVGIYHHTSFWQFRLKTSKKHCHSRMF
ncbi:MAG: polysaccharide deacetylase family protein [Candidatus Omnitrophota bacterium]